MKIRLGITFGFIFFALLGCGVNTEIVQHEEKYGSICDCIGSIDDPNIDLVLSLCLPTKFDREDVDDYVLKEIDECEPLFNAILKNRDNYILNLARSNVKKISPTSDSDNDKLLWKQSSSLLNNHLDSVLIYSDKILENDPENTQVLLFKGYALEKTCEYRKARKVYRQLQNLNTSQFGDLNPKLLKKTKCK